MAGIFLCLLAQSSFAQTEKGRFLIGGSADISEIFQGTTSTFNMSLAPSFGVFVVKGLAVGGRYVFGVGSVRTLDTKKNEYSVTTTFTSQAGLNLKYYLGKKALKGVASVTGAYVVTTVLKKNSISNLDGFAVTGLLGMAYFFNPHISLETGMYLSASGFKSQLPSSRIGFSVGLFAFLDKKKQE